MTIDTRESFPSHPESGAVNLASIARDVFWDCQDQSSENHKIAKAQAGIDKDPGLAGYVEEIVTRFPKDYGEKMWEGLLKAHLVGRCYYEQRHPESPILPTSPNVTRVKKEMGEAGSEAKGAGIETFRALYAKDRELIDVVDELDDEALSDGASRMFVVLHPFLS